MVVGFPLINPYKFFIHLLILSLFIPLMRTFQVFSERAGYITSTLIQTQKASYLEKFGQLPLQFEQNLGQTDDRVKFISKAQNYNLYLTNNSAIFNFQNSNSLSVLGMNFINANPFPEIAGVNTASTKTNYLKGNNPNGWLSAIPNFLEVEYKQLYTGIDAIFYGNNGKLEYDFIVSPGADPELIELGLDGIDSAIVNAGGNLVLGIGGQEIQFQKPFIYQEIGGFRREITGGYLLRDGRVGFQVGTYDNSKPLIIDPVLSYSTYLGGSGSDESGDISVDSLGNVYVTGRTNSIDLPTSSGSLQTNNGGGLDAFVTKLNSTGTAVVFSTYIGGSNSDVGQGITVDSNGNAYVVGRTNSFNFPVFNAFQPGFGGGADDAFIVKLNSTGTGLVYSTYFGGSGNEDGIGIVRDTSNNIYVVGTTTSINFPTTIGAFQTSYGGGTGDVFAAKLNTAGSAFVYATYLGGSDLDHGIGLTIDSSGNAYVTGNTASVNFPTTQGAFQTIHGGVFDAYVAKLNFTGSSLEYSTYLGGSQHDSGIRLTVDSSGNAFMTGITASTNFPTTPGAFQTDQNSEDAFGTKLSTNGSSLIYSTYLGGSNEDRGTGITVDSSGNAYVVGFTNSAAFFPTTPDAIQSVFGGIRDAFLAKLNSTGSALIYSSYMGGSNQDFGGGIAIDPSGNVYVTGATFSADFPITPGAFQTTYGGGSSDGFIAKIGFNQPPIANAGPDQIVVVKNQVILNGSASSDPNFDSLTYHWSENAGNPQANVLSSTTVVNPTFTPQVAGTYQFSLVVNDGFVDSSPDTVVITVQTSAQAIQSLIDLVEQFNLQQGIQNSLDAKLDVAQQALSDMNQNNNISAINSLNSFISAVEAQRGNKITSAQADMLIQAAQAILNGLN